MRLPKKAHYAVLMCLFLTKNPRAGVYEIAKSLDLSVSFMEQIACKLRAAGIVESIRGPGGGYALRETPTIGAVLAAAGVDSLMDPSEYADAYAYGGGSAYGGLASMVDLMQAALGPVLKEPITTLASSSEMLEVA